MGNKESEEFNGYFSKLHRELGGDIVNLKGFQFKKEVLNQYTDLSMNYPMEFRFEEKVGIYINHVGKWDLKCSRLKNGNIGAILIDLTNIPTDQQTWWFDHMVEDSV